MNRLIIALTVFILTGCGATTVNVDGYFPKPLVDPIPLKMGVYYSDHFREYSHQIEDKNKGNYLISTGTAQVRLFDTLFSQFFTDIRELSVLPTAAEPVPVNAVLAPEIEELQFTIPRETRSQVFEVWVKYRMNLYSAQGDPLLNWPVTAYGKTPMAFMKSREEALEQAAVVALRDAGANFTTSFSRLPKLRRWLDGELNRGAGDLPAKSPHSKQKQQATDTIDASIVEVDKLLKEDGAASVE